ncbi:MAG: LytTR family DNA-binding domain-containing protein [Prevotella sp.]|jgi:DNA-binding LytR/AlgR family response regulator|nr:LytTR family DNA-binding domain-containing protein [Prevotella sp.]MCI2079581.1 LytTR family DNA-binding domain-containing protein [Prevotella sp.]MCI2101673.1 LytTR family DNA-binding domain-containing protein [Prevotella sp.]
MKVLIIEDEQHNFNRLKKLLLAYDATMQVEGPLETIDETRDWLHSHQGNEASDIVFSDIRLADGLCFDALSELNPSSMLVFTTAYDEYALQAFRYNGIAYLLKPVDEEELRATLNRIQDLRATNTHLQSILATMQQSSLPYRERFLVPYKDGYELVTVDDISHICTEYKDTRLYLTSGRFFSITMTLEEIESQLNPRDFFRVNRQTIISIHAVNGLKTWFGGKLRVRLANYPDTEVLCSREKASALKAWLGK